MTLHRLTSITREATLLAFDITTVMSALALCKLLGHPEPLRWQDMAAGPIGVCKRCSNTVVS